jgi:hypothetical protein
VVEPCEGECEDALHRLEATLRSELLFHESVDQPPIRAGTRGTGLVGDMLYVELVMASAGLIRSRVSIRLAPVDYGEYRLSAPRPELGTTATSCCSRPSSRRKTACSGCFSV